MKKVAVLFVCLGNICRSPVAAGVFKHLVKERGLEQSFLIDSCGTGNWHSGETAHSETRRVATKRGVSLASHRARQAKQEDFSRFQLIVAMDRTNLRDLKQMARNSSARLVTLREYDPEDTDPDVPDPFYGGEDGFETVHDIIHRCCEKLLDSLVEELEP